MDSTTDVTSLDAYRREVHEAAADEHDKATKRFIRAMIVHWEAEAANALEVIHGDIMPKPVYGEAYAYAKGKADGLRLALSAVCAEPVSY